MPVPDSRGRKKITFYENEKRQIDLRIRLKYDDMTQSQFFRAVITGYLEQDENIMKYIDKYKERYEVQGKPRRRKSQILEKKGKETKKQFSLEKEEIENIFDIIEREHPEL